MPFEIRGMEATIAQFKQLAAGSEEAAKRAVKAGAKVLAQRLQEKAPAVLSKEEAGRLAQRQAKFIAHLEAALVRIENKTYGICRVTGKLISKERLRAVPHATLSMDAKMGQDS